MRHSRLFALLCALFATVLAGCNGGGVNLTTSNGAAASSSTSSVNLNAEEPVVEIRSVASAQPGGRRYVLNISGQTTTGSAYSHSNFVIKGGGLQGISQPPYGLQQFTYPYMALMAGNIGANCIRTYGAALSQQTPEQQKSDFSAALTWAATATSNGTPMYVAIGLTMLPSTQLDYTNTNAGSPLLTQRTGIQSLVDEAIALDNSRQLLWVIGNELAQSPHESVRTAVYNEIDVIAQYIKNKGSTLPCMTAVPAVSVAELKLIAASCTHLDVLGVNDYYGHFGTTAGGGFLNGLNSVMSTSHGAADGWQKPYIVSEFGSYDVPAVGSMPTAALPSPPPFTPAGVYGLEACSTQIAQDYLSNYQSYIQPFTSGGGTCLGSFAYVWENPVFSNNFAYFFEIFVTSHSETPSYNPPGKLRLQAVDSLISAWGGTSPGTLYPQIASADGDPQGIQCTFKGTQATPFPTAIASGSSQTASITASYASQLTFYWYLVDDTTNHYNPQGYAGTTSTAIGTATTSGPLSAQKSTLTFTAPTTPGNYQLRVVITNEPAPPDHFGQNTAATAAILFVVQ